MHHAGMLTLVAGATGMLGREVVATLTARGERVRILTRARSRGEAIGVSDIAIGDAMHPHTLTSAFAGVGAVVSCLGAPVAMDLSSRAGYITTDVVANSHLIDAALHVGVSRFVYTSVHGAPGYDHTQYVRAHLLVEERLRASGLSHSIVRPTGLYPVFDAFLDMARRGFCSIPGDGSAKTNPVHPADVAERCVKELLTRASATIAIGGPEILTRQQLVEMAFAAVDRSPRIAHVPPALFIAIGKGLRPLHPRLGELLDFAARAFTHDSIAPATGTRTLADYFKDRVARTNRG